MDRYTDVSEVFAPEGGDYEPEKFCQGLYGVPHQPAEEVVNILTDQLQRIVEDYSDEINKGKCKVELECRLGTIINPGGTRLNLPIIGSALLEHSRPECQYFWDGGLNHLKFQALLKKVRTLLNLPQPTDKIKPNKPLSQENVKHTKDEIVRLQERSTSLLDKQSVKEYRRSYLMPKTPTSMPVEIIKKENLLTMHIYMGKDKDEGNDLHDTDQARDNQDNLIDVRIAVALEWDMRSEYRPNAGQVVNVRERKRHSFPLFGSSVIDATEVSTEPLDRNGKRIGYESVQETHEFEVEMAHDSILNGIRKIQMDPNDASLKIELGNIIRLVRGCADFLNGNEAGNANAQLADTTTDLADIQIPEEQLSDYLKFVSPVTPIIGDYLFRAVGANRSQVHRGALDLKKTSTAPPLTEDEITLSVRSGLSEVDKLALAEERLKRSQL